MSLYKYADWPIAFHEYEFFDQFEVEFSLNSNGELSVVSIKYFCNYHPKLYKYIQVKTYFKLNEKCCFIIIISQSTVPENSFLIAYD